MNARRMAPSLLWNRQRRAVWGAARYELTHSEPELGLVSEHGDPAGTFVDVGANIGVYAYTALSNFERVVAVEANPDLIQDLERALGSKTTVVNAALSDEPGSASFWIPTRGSGDVHTRGSLLPSANPGFDQRQIDVDVTTLDDLGLQRVAFVKIDVEGHELAVLRGATETIRRDRPTFLVESEERHNPGGVSEVLDFFAAHDYQGQFLHGGGMQPVSSFRLEEHQPADQVKTVDGTLSSAYVNNFLFTPVS